MDFKINASKLGRLLIEHGGVGIPDQIQLGLQNSGKNPASWRNAQDAVLTGGGTLTPVIPKPPGKGPGGLPDFHRVAIGEIHRAFTGYDASNPTVSNTQLNDFFLEWTAPKKQYNPSAPPPSTWEQAQLRPVDLIAAGLACHWYAEANPNHALSTVLSKLSNQFIDVGIERLSVNDSIG
jgi:hypothetical protein